MLLISLIFQEYVQRLEECGKENPELLIAHAYTRYLGDLSGGQILKRLAQRNYGLKSDGTNFYDFPLVSNMKVFKDR